jgi:hypothetical protein
MICSIPLAFYQTLWFRLLCAAVLLVLAWLMLLMRVEQVKGRLRERLDERHAERERIARDLHDTLLQGIQALLFRLQIWAGDTRIASERREEIAAVVVQARAIVVEGRDRILALRSPACRPASPSRTTGAGRGSDYLSHLPNSSASSEILPGPLAKMMNMNASHWIWSGHAIG